MFHDIKLDDKSFEEIKNEAISHIVDHCPEWTNHNSSDPGITLVELFSYMTELTQYRLNKVPQKNYLAFLDLLGIKQRLATPAKSRVQFKLSTGYQMGQDSKDTVFIKKGSVLSSIADEENEALTYETNKDFHISNAKLINLYSKSFDKERKKSRIINYSKNLETKKAFFPFNKNGTSDNRSEIYLFCDELYVLQNDVKMSVLFRLPTSMRTFDITDDFLQMMQWEFYDGISWQRLDIAYDLNINIDDNDADVISVTFNGNNELFEKGNISQFSENEQFYIRAILNESPIWLPDFSVYEVSIVTNSNDDGVLPQSCYYNYEQLDMNNNFYPFGTRPTIGDAMLDELFYIRCDQAFIEKDTKVIIEFMHSNSASYTMPKGYDNIQIIWEYSLGNGKWNQLDVNDLSSNFTQQGSISFIVPKSFEKVIINAEEGYWIRGKIVSGNYGQEEISIFDSQTNELKITPATLNPPVLSSINIKYSQPRHDIDKCYVFNNYKYEPIVFEKNKPVNFFKQDTEYEEALYLGFDSYLSEKEIIIYFDLENIEELNYVNGQRVLKWEILHQKRWVALTIEDETEGLSISGDVKIKLPKIESLEEYTLYIDTLKRMWLRVSVLFNSMKSFPKINMLLLNSVEVSQQKSFKNETIGFSQGLPDMKFFLDNNNLVNAPIVVIEDVEYKAVERFIDYGKDEPIFRFNGITGEIKFGDGVYGKIPPLGAEIIVKKYATTAGAKGNLPAKKINILQEAINYVDSVENISSCIDGHDSDSIDDLKRFAPSVLKTMQRAVNVEDYEHLSLQYSTFVKKAKCIVHNNEVIILIMNQNIIKDRGFLKPSFIRELQSYLEDLSMITVKPKVQGIVVSSLKVNIKLKYSDETTRPIRSILEQELLTKVENYFDPLTGLHGNGYPIGRKISKNDFQSIVTAINSSCFISELTLIKDSTKSQDSSIVLSYNEVVAIENVILEELSYDF